MRPVLILCATIVAMAATILPGKAETELLMLEQPGCAWCARFNADIAPAYAKTAAGQRAPLRRVDIKQPWPEDLKNIRAERYTPTFILLDDNQEIGRIRGYPGDNWFWVMLDELLAKLDKGDQSG